MKFNEVMTQIVLTSHLVGFDVLSVSMKTWNAMSADKQRAFQAAASKAIAYSTAEYVKREHELAEEFKRGGLDVYTPNLAAFRDYAQKVYKDAPDAKSWPAGMLDKINAMT